MAWSRTASCPPLRTPTLLVTERFDRIQPRSLAGRIEAEEDPDAGGEAEGEHDGFRRDEGAPLGEVTDRARAAEAERDAGDPADQRERDGLDQELEQDVTPPGADRHPQADLARPLRDRDQHDVHDTDATDEQGERR